MSGDIGEAVGAILGVAFGGYLLLRMAGELNSTGTVNLTTWGTTLIIAAVLAAIILVLSIMKSVTR